MRNIGFAHGTRVGEQFVDGQTCRAGKALKQSCGRPMDVVHEIRNRRLAYPNLVCKGRLRNLLPLKVGSKCFHRDPGVGGLMDADPIGFAYQNAIGQSYPQPVHNSGMGKKSERSFLERAVEALGERYPREKPTQRRIAQLAGVSQPSANEWGEVGRGPAMHTGIRLAKALGVCVEWLYTERGPKRPGAAGETDDDLSPILEAWPDLPPDVRRQVAKYTDFVRGDEPKRR